MARILNNALYVLIALAALIQISSAQNSYVVGDGTGWTVPGSPSVYSNWASGKKFSVGDVLVFNFATGAHDVTEVTKAAYDACNAASPISRLTNGPANVTLKAGEHYFICGFPGHCTMGQKLHVTVSAASSSPAPTPQASAPTPAQMAPSTPPSAAAPAPTQGPVATPSSAPSPARTPSSSATPPSGGAMSPSDSTPPSVPLPQSPGAEAMPPTDDNFASSLGVTGVSATFLTALVAFLL